MLEQRLKVLLNPIFEFCIVTMPSVHFKGQFERREKWIEIEKPKEFLKHFWRNSFFSKIGCFQQTEWNKKTTKLSITLFLFKQTKEFKSLLQNNEEYWGKVFFFIWITTSNKNRVFIGYFAFAFLTTIPVHFPRRNHRRKKFFFLQILLTNFLSCFHYKVNCRGFYYHSIFQKTSKGFFCF